MSSGIEEAMNQWGSERVPFLFIIDFEINVPIAIPLERIDAGVLKYDVNGISNTAELPTSPGATHHLKPHPPSLHEYRKKFDSVYGHLERGDSYLTNLTIRSAITPPCSLEDLFRLSHAKYKVLVRDQFLVFSPETFIQVRNNTIYSFPMKGTIDAALPAARQTILNDPKELAEHVTIVDLIRNDISQVADDVRVARFRYIDEIRTTGRHLLQVSSEITGQLPGGWQGSLGTLLLKLLPAGSVSGAPKHKTIEIIRKAEGQPRGYYTGVCGIFDGQNVDSGVMIRFIEKVDGKLYYRSGGGITTQSVCEAEYQEAIDKIYVPVN